MRHQRSDANRKRASQRKDAKRFGGSKRISRLGDGLTKRSEKSFTQKGRIVREGKGIN